jgi:hypothetical protein
MRISIYFECVKSIPAYPYYTCSDIKRYMKINPDYNKNRFIGTIIHFRKYPYHIVLSEKVTRSRILK